MEHKNTARTWTFTAGFLTVGLAVLMIFCGPSFAQSDYEYDRQYRGDTSGSRGMWHGSQDWDDEWRYNRNDRRQSGYGVNYSDRYRDRDYGGDYQSRTDRQYDRRMDRGYGSDYDYRDRGRSSRDYDYRMNRRDRDYGQRDYDWERDRDRRYGQRDYRSRDYDFGMDTRERRGGQGRYREYQGAPDIDYSDQRRYGRDQRDERGRSGYSRGYYEERKPRSKRSSGKFDRVEGNVRDVKAIALTGLDEKHMIVRLDTEENRTAKVDLGPQKRVSDLKIKEGEPIVIMGSPGTINDQPMLMAHWVEIGDKRQTIKRPQDRNLKRYTGQILKTKKATFGDESQNHLMARIRTDDGDTTIVNLGPEKELLNSLNIEKGKSFSMLARPVNINGQRALVAEVINVGDRTVNIDWEKIREKSRYGQDQGQQQTN